jgi:DNA-binding NarL/FixJ family response regulator
LPTRSRILIADDHNLVAELCKRLLETEFDVIGIVGDGRSLVRSAINRKPDVIVLDIAMPILNGLDAGCQVKKDLPAVKLVYVTMSTDLEVAAEAFRCGASGYLLKTCAPAELVIAVRDVLRGKRYISSGLPKETIGLMSRQNKKLVAQDKRLTDREREVLRLLVEGRHMKEIAEALNIKIRTVAYHKYRIQAILGAKTNADLVKFAIKTQLVAA